MDVPEKAPFPALTQRQMEDLNNSWVDPENPQIEVEGVKDWLELYLGKGHSIHRAMDVHCWGQEKHFLYLTNNDKEFNELINKHMYFNWWKIGNEKSANAYFEKIIGVQSATVEISQKHNNTKALLSQDDYRQAGVAILEAHLDELTN